MNDLKDQFLIEIEQAHAPLSHNLNGQSTDNGAYFQ